MNIVSTVVRTNKCTLCQHFWNTAADFIPVRCPKCFDGKGKVWKRERKDVRELEVFDGTETKA